MLVFNKISKKYEIIDENNFDEYSEVREQIIIPQKLDDYFNIISPERTIDGKILSFTGSHVDCDNITSYYNQGFKLLLYKKCRDIIKSKVSEIGFANLNEAEKNITCKLLLGTPEERNTIFSVEQQIYYGNIWQTKSKEYRVDRVNRIFSELYNRILKSDILTILPEINQLVDNYLHYGIEEKSKDGSIGIVDYFLGQEDFSGAGFPAKTFLINGFQDSISLSNHIVSIFNGDII